MMKSVLGGMLNSDRSNELEKSERDRQQKQTKFFSKQFRNFASMKNNISLSLSLIFGDMESKGRRDHIFCHHCFRYDIMGVENKLTWSLP